MNRGVDHLFSKGKALISVPSSKEKKEKEGRKEGREGGQGRQG
jgi:hypothetical protein